MTTILNDTHLGTKRQAGTTPGTQSTLRSFIINQFSGLVKHEADDHLIINGDLFDSFSVEPSDLIVAYSVLADYLDQIDNTLTLIMGNHDYSPKGDKVSSFHLLAHFLTSRFKDQVQVIDHTCGLTRISAMCHAIPHMPNQDLFDIEIEKATQNLDKASIGYLLLHCNIESPFAEHSDHSLNLNTDQVDALVAAGWTLVVGHEHQARTLRGGRVIVTGNQIPTSIADCLHNPNNKKEALRILPVGHHTFQVLDLGALYTEVNWREIDQNPDLDSKSFIRVSGNCTAEEAAEMVNAIGKLRQSVNAFVVSNAVTVEGVAQMESLAELSLEQMSQFDVLGALLEELTPRERDTVKELLK